MNTRLAAGMNTLRNGVIALTILITLSALGYGFYNFGADMLGHVVQIHFPLVDSINAKLAALNTTLGTMLGIGLLLTLGSILLFGMGTFRYGGVPLYMSLISFGLVRISLQLLVLYSVVSLTFVLPLLAGTVGSLVVAAHMGYTANALPYVAGIAYFSICSAGMAYYMRHIGDTFRLFCSPLRLVMWGILHTLPIAAAILSFAAVATINFYGAIILAAVAFIVALAVTVVAMPSKQ